MLNVLIVDDDEELLEMVGVMINANNMKATCISKGSEVLSTLNVTSIDFILMDIYLGTEDGRKLTRQIKLNERFNHIPVLLYSAGAVAPESIRESLADDFIPKPFDMPALIGKIRKMVI